MEKLSIEEKAKRYDEAIEKAKHHYYKGKAVGYTRCIISDIFPEVKEKTDEEMIQKLIAVCHLYYGEGEDAERDECLKWLEKQIKKLQDNSNIGVNKEEKVDNADTTDDANKVEPKINIGDYVVRKDGKDFPDGRRFAKIIKIDTTMYQFDCGSWLYNAEIRLWTLADAQDGDILASYDNKPFIYNGNFNEWNVGAYCGINIYDEFTIADRKCNWCCNRNIKPATKEQRQSLFNEINLLNYVWNPKTKELNRLG